LLAYDSTVLEMARQEGVDLGVKLKLAWEELGIELTRFLVVAGKGDLGLRNISVTAPLEKCHAFRSLALAYSDAAHRQRNDRYRERAKEWERQAAWAWEALLDTGVGIVERPVEKASMPAVELVELRASAATYWVRIAWISSSGSEGAASEPSMVSASENQGLLVTARGGTGGSRGLERVRRLCGGQVRQAKRPTAAGWRELATAGRGSRRGAAAWGGPEP
jgi:hypothetical protein